MSGDVAAIKLIGSFYLGNEPEQTDQLHELDPTMVKMMKEMGLNVDGIAKRDDVIISCNGLIDKKPFKNWRAK